MELSDSSDEEFKEYEKIYLCGGVAITLLDEMIKDITKRSRPCSRNRIIITRLIKVLCRLINIIRNDLKQFNVALEEFKCNCERLKNHKIFEPIGTELLVFKDKISKLKSFKALLESESFSSNKCSESSKETTKVDHTPILSHYDDLTWDFTIEKNKVHTDEIFFSYDCMILKSESYRDDLVKLTTEVKSKQHLPALLSPTKDYEDSKIIVEIRKCLFDDLMSLKKILMGLISNTEASSSFREILEPKYRCYDIDGGFDRNMSKIFIESGAKTFYRCSGESAIFLHGEKEENEFMTTFRTLCDKLSEKESNQIFRYTKKSKLGVSENEDCLKFVRTGDCTDHNLIKFHDQIENAREIMEKYGEMGRGTVSCILQLITDSHAKTNNESLSCDNNPYAIFSDCDDEKDNKNEEGEKVERCEEDSSQKQKRQFRTNDECTKVKNYVVTAAHVLFDGLKLQKKIIERNDSEVNKVENNTEMNRTDLVINDQSSNQSFNNTAGDHDDGKSNLADYYDFNNNPLIPAVYNFEVDFALIPLLSKNDNTIKNSNNINDIKNDKNVDNNDGNHDDNNHSEYDENNNTNEKSDNNNDNNSNSDGDDSSYFYTDAGNLEDMGCEVFVIENDMSGEWMSWYANESSIESGTIIAKLGIKTGLTIGKFVGFGDVTSCNEDVQYRNCIFVKSFTENSRFCLPGDSGSLYLVRDTNYDYECNNISSLHYGKTYWRPIGIHRTSDSIESETKFSYACSFTECLKKLKEKKKIPDFTSIKIYCGLVKMSTAY